MKKFLDYDPWTGITSYTEDDGDKIILQNVQEDVSPLLEKNKIERREGFADRGIAGHIKKYCDLPTGVGYEMLKKGIDPYNLTKATFPRFAQEIEQNYPMLKVTEKKAWRPK